MAKIAVSLPDDVLREIEKERLASGQSRSEFVRGAVLVYLLLKRAKAYDAEYILGYLKVPETEEELGWVEAASQAVLAEYPWDDESQ